MNRRIGLFPAALLSLVVVVYCMQRPTSTTESLAVRDVGEQSKIDQSVAASALQPVVVEQSGRPSLGRLRHRDGYHDLRDLMDSGYRTANNIRFLNPTWTFADDGRVRHWIGNATCVSEHYFSAEVMVGPR